MSRPAGHRGADLAPHTASPNDLLPGRTIGHSGTEPMPPRAPGHLSFEPEASAGRRAADASAKPWDATARD